MRYRVSSYSAVVTQVGESPDTLTISFRIPEDTYDRLPSVAADLKKAVTEATRLVADESEGGYLLAMTGQKITIDSVTKDQISGPYYLHIVFKKAALLSTAVDADDLAAINSIFDSAATLTDQFTIEMDFGEIPSNLATKEDVPTAATIKEGLATSNDVSNAKSDIMGGAQGTGKSVKDVYDNVGAKVTSDTNEPTSLFGWFRRLWSQLTDSGTAYSKQGTGSNTQTDVYNAVYDSTKSKSVNDKIGNLDDMASTITSSGSVFGRLRDIVDNYLNNGTFGLSKLAKESQVKSGNDTVIEVANTINSTKIGTNADQASETSGSGTIFGRLRAIIDNYLDNNQYGLGPIKTKVDTTDTKIGTVDTANGQSVYGDMAKAGTPASGTAPTMVDLGEAISAIPTTTPSTQNDVNDARDKVMGGTGYGAGKTGKSIKEVYDNLGDPTGDKTVAGIVESVQEKVGENLSSDASEPTSLFSWFRKLWTYIPGMSGAVIDTTNSTTAVAEARSANTKLGTTLDTANSSIFGYLYNIWNKLVNDISKESSVSVETGGITYTSIGELRSNSYGLSQIKDKSDNIDTKIGTVNTSGGQSVYGDMAKDSSVKSGNDTAIGVLQDVRTKIGTPPQNHTVSGDLTQILQVLGLVIEGFSIEENQDVDDFGNPCYTLVVDDTISFVNGEYQDITLVAN